MAAACRRHVWHSRFGIMLTRKQGKEEGPVGAAKRRKYGAEFRNQVAQRMPGIGFGTVTGGTTE